jgi:hypothetical protein
MTFDPTPYAIGPALLYWLIAAGIFAAVALVVALAISLLTQGFGGLAFVGQQLGDGVRDFTRMSFRRIGALTTLTFKESLRRKTLLVFVIFALLFMFGGWFLANATDRAELQVKVYTSFVLTAISWMILPVALLLSCWGLPQDIKDRSLHTVVTKPTRRNEIVIGRFLGFAAIGTLVLVFMSLVGYFWILRNFPVPSQSTELEHDGTRYAVTARLGPETELQVRNLTTGETAEFVAPNDLLVRDQVSEQYPDLAAQLNEFLDETRDEGGPVLVSRVPVYGALSFTDREGNPAVKGINTGDIWEFRGYIEGATRASALWEFDGVTADRLGDAILLESHFESFRTHKGTMGQGLTAEFRLINDLRTQSALALNAGDEFKAASDLVAGGDFTGAGRELAKLADGLEKEQVDLAQAEYQAVGRGYAQFAALLGPIADTQEGSELARLRDFSSRAAAAGEAANRRGLAEALQQMAEQFTEKNSILGQQVTDLIVPLPTFEVQEFKENLLVLRRNVSFFDQEAKTMRRVDLFDDLTHGGKLRVRVLCLDPGQYIGMARPDLFIRTPDQPFAAGYFKAVGGIWLMMLLLVALGVTASTFVKGPVAILLTLTLLILGTGFHSFLDQLASGELEGAGATESAIRLVRHLNPTVPLEESTGVKVVQTTDRVIGGGLWLVDKIVPDFNRFRLTEYVANGFDVPWNAALLPAIALVLAYIIPCLLIGYYSLKLRELEAK